MSRVFLVPAFMSLIRMCFVVLLFPWPAAIADEVTSTVLVGDARLEVVIEAGKLQVSRVELLDWVQSAAAAVAGYYGRYPVPHVVIRIIPVQGSGVRHGQTFGRGGGSIKIRVGGETTAADLAADWMLTHEMVHLSFPSVAEEHHWIEEGIATYVEPIARIRAKQLAPEQMWADLVRDLPKGLPRQGDAGLDHTHTWGRTYWGGAVFCFLADVEIRRKTNRQKGLEDALRAILYAGGDIRSEWDLQETLRKGDRATGVTVLSELYDRMKNQPVDTDLPALWNQLGIESDGTAVHFNDSAPLAPIRRSITDGSTFSRSASAAAASR
jgi:hypothetical protein